MIETIETLDKRMGKRLMIVSPAKVFESPLPLANPESLFSYGVWLEVLNFVADYLKNRKRKMADNLQLLIHDLYFSKYYDQTKDFGKAEKLFSEFWPTEFRIDEPHDRNDERHLTIGQDKEMALYEFRGGVCFSVGGAVALDQNDVKQGRFPRKPIRWQLQVRQFLALVDIIEKVLSGRGTPHMCRVFMEVHIRHASIIIGCFYQLPFYETHAKIWGWDMARIYRKYLRPKFILSFT